MLDFIPDSMFKGLYYNILLGFVMLTLFHTQVLHINDRKNLSYINSAGWAAFVFILVFIGFRPVIPRIFIDMPMYGFMFDMVQRGFAEHMTGDLMFNILLRFCTEVTNVDGFFAICAAVYTIPCVVISKRYFKKYWFYCFLIMICSFSFFNYGTNTIRNGMASAVFLLALAFIDNKKVMIPLMLLSTLFHKSLTLPFLAFLLTLVYNDPKTYLMAWFMAIPLSLALGGFWENLFAGMGFDDRASYLTAEVDASKFSRTGFRWDFVAFSGLGVFSGWYFLIKREFNDVYYPHIYNTFLTANAFWILVIRANFSDRFSYLSWFMLGLVIIYPLLKQEFFKKQNAIIGLVITGFFMFTYLMNFALKGFK